MKLASHVDVVLQPHGSFISSRRLKRFDVLNRPATSLLLRAAVRGFDASSLPQQAAASGSTLRAARALMSVLASKGYLTDHGDRPNARVEFVDQPTVLKATRAEIEVTNRCNLHCVYCYAEVNSNRTEMPYSRLIDLLDGMKAHGLKAVLFSGGEPFLRRDFLDIVDYAAQDLIVEINTNGWFITEQVAERIAAADLKLVQVSLDSPTREYHDSVRGEGSFERAVTAMTRLVRAGVPTRASCVVTSSNKDSLPELKVFASELGVQLKADPVTRTGFARRIGDDEWASRFQASRHDRISNAEPMGDAPGFEPVCQSQVGYVAVSHLGILKPCNMREQFFDPTGGVLLEGDNWWDRFYGETRMASVVVSSPMPDPDTAGRMKSEFGGYLCDLQLSVRHAGHISAIPVELSRKPASV